MKQIEIPGPAPQPTRIIEKAVCHAIEILSERGRNHRYTRESIMEFRPQFVSRNLAGMKFAEGLIQHVSRQIHTGPAFFQEITDHCHARRLVSHPDLKMP